MWTPSSSTERSWVWPTTPDPDTERGRPLSPPCCVFIFITFCPALPEGRALPFILCRLGEHRSGQVNRYIRKLHPMERQDDGPRRNPPFRYSMGIGKIISPPAGQVPRIRRELEIQADPRAVDPLVRKVKYQNDDAEYRDGNGFKAIHTSEKSARASGSVLLENHDAYRRASYPPNCNCPIGRVRSCLFSPTGVVRASFTLHP